MVKEIAVIDIIPRLLSFDVIAMELFNEINKIPDNEIIIDFKGIEHMCVSFAQEYSRQKRLSNKKISEKNLSGEYVNLITLAKNLYV